MNEISSLIRIMRKFASPLSALCQVGTQGAFCKLEDSFARTQLCEHPDLRPLSSLQNRKTEISVV